MRNLIVYVLIMVSLLMGCTQQLPPSESGPSKIDDENGITRPEPLADLDFCIQGLTLTSTGEVVRSTLKPNGRQTGGYDFGFRWTQVYLSSDGNKIEALQGAVTDLCNNQQRLQLRGYFEVTPAQVERVYGEPTQKVGDGKEYWFYFDRSRSQVLIFAFMEGKTHLVQLARKAIAVRQWYPLLGDLQGPKPLSSKDAALGPVQIGMDSDVAVKVLGSAYDEGEAQPYFKYIFRDKGIELRTDSTVRAIYASGKADLKTPRDIRVGVTTSELRKAYGEPRVFTNRDGNQIWSYESLKDGVGLVFEIKNDAVTRMETFDFGYQYRPYVK